MIQDTLSMEKHELEDGKGRRGIDNVQNKREMLKLELVIKVESIYQKLLKQLRKIGTWNI